ncbi:segregation/condensation protein A [bacterium]|nr:segregation/condensation protein A [bacterium]
MAEALNVDLDNLVELGNYKNKTQAEGIEILVQMAKAGKIDPWNIDIIDVTDKYLAHLFEMKTQNLRATGKTFLFASILLRLKSNILEGNNIFDFEEDYQQDDYEIIDDEIIDNYEPPTNNVISFNEVLQRRSSVKLNRNRTVTLKELIRQLEFYEMLEKKQSLKQAHERAIRRVRSYANLSAEDIVNLAHEEFIENSVKSIQMKLEKIFNKTEKVELNELVSIGMSKISAYIALLFLTADGVCDLEQNEFYSDLYVVKSNGTTES